MVQRVRFTDSSQLLLSAMVLSVFVALILTPALCATLLKPIPKGSHGVQTGFFGWFNRVFEKSSHHYTDSVSRTLRGTGRYLLIYVLLVAAMAIMFVRLPASFLPEEDQGVLLTMVQLPAGSTQEQTQDVVAQVNDFTLILKKKMWLSRSLPSAALVLVVKVKTWGLLSSY